MIIACWRKFLLPRHKAEGKGRCLFVFFRGTHFLALSGCFLILQIRYAFVLAQSPRVRAYRFLRKPPEYLLRWSYYRLYAWLASYECAQRLCGSAGRWRSFHLYYERLFLLCRDSQINQLSKWIEKSRDLSPWSPSPQSSRFLPLLIFWIIPNVIGQQWTKLSLLNLRRNGTIL